MLKGKKVLLAVSSSIAAYKTANLVRLFKKEGSEVQVVLTKSSLNFITPLTLSTLSDNKVLTGMIDKKSGEWNSHVKLGLWADFMVIAPLTSNTMSKMATGECDNLLLSTYMSAKCPVYFAPAMDLDMFKHSSTVKNIKTLQSFGNILIPSGFGELASGLVGEGRMAEPLEIIEFICNDLNKNLSLTNKNILITAGPTYEAIDPIRYIGNHSTGLMGIELAKACAKKGSNVTLILGPTHLECKHSNIIVKNVESSEQMHIEVKKVFSKCDIGIFSAAVADYKVAYPSEHKIKKKNELNNLELVRTKDILLEMSNSKLDSQFLVGFALETENEIENAKHKLKIKKLDMIVLNSLNNKGAGFKNKTNKISIIDKKNKVTNFDLKDKSLVAEDIVNKIIELL